MAPPDRLPYERPAAGWCALDVDVWPMLTDAITQAHPDGWPREVAMQDLRWWADRIRMGAQRRPGARKLAERWGWTHWATRALLREVQPFDSLAPHSSRTPAAQSPHSSRTPPAHFSEETQGASVEPRTPAAQSPHSSRTPPAHIPPHARSRQSTEYREQRTETLELVAPVEAPEPPPSDWDRLNAEYAALPSCKALRSPSKGLGESLSRLLDAHGFDGARLMLRWMAYASDCPKRASLRESGHDTLATVGRVSHVEAYWPHVARWKQRGCQGDPERQPVARKALTLDEQIARDEADLQRRIASGELRRRGQR